VLKAGKIRLSLDPQAPAARLREVLEHAGVAVAITDEEHRAQLADVPSLMPIHYADTRMVSDFTPAVDISDDSPATIFYTSGSTGRPKGVVLTHGSESQPWAAREGPTAFVRGDRVALLHDLSFAATRRAISGPLLVGASIHVFDLRRRGTEGLGEWLDREGITFLPLPVPIMKAVTRQRAAAGPLPSLRCVSVGGDHVYREHLREFLEAVGPGCLVSHGYGLTEVGVVSQLVLDDVERLADAVLPAGSLLPGVRVEFRDVEPDGVGRLVISTSRMAAGYWREPELTGKAFVDDPSDPGVTKFFSEDLGRFRPDGMLELRGRADARVKVRGYSVDLSELERVIAGLRGVRESVVVLDSSDRARPKLVAYVVGAEATPAALRRALRELLPPYQVPAQFVVLEAFPTTERGKIDRKALPPPPVGRTDLDQPWAGPRDELDAALVGAWQHVLGVGPVGIHDDLNELGADSLLMAEAAVAASEELGRDLPYALFVEATTVAEAADLLRSGQAQSLSNLAALQPEGSSPPLFMVPAGGDATRFARLGSHLAPDQPLYGFQVRGAKGRRALGRVERLASYYLARLLEVQPNGPYLIGGYSGGCVVAYEMARRLHDMGRTPTIVVLIDAPAPDPRGSLPQPRLAFKTWFRRRVLLLPFLFTNRPIPSRWRRRYHLERLGLAVPRYRPGPYPGPLVLVRASQHWVGRPPDLGWGPLVEGEVKVVEVPGSHESILQAPAVRILAERLREELSAATEGSASLTR
jgi:aspartate racemase